MPNSLLLTYCLTILIASMIPGPSMFLALGQGARFGFWAGAVGGAGNVLASLIQAVIAFSIILEIGQISHAALMALRILGAFYIIYIGFTLFRVKSFGASKNSSEPSVPPARWTHLRDGFLFAIANPKALTFFGALFPQFIQSNDLQAAHLLTVFLPIALIAYACFLIYVVAGSTLLRLFNQSQNVGVVFGCAVVLSGMILLIST